MPKALIITVGIGSGVEYAIAKSVRDFGSHFTLFLTTPKSKQEKLPQVFKLLPEQEKPADYFTDEFEEENDVQKLYCHYRDVIYQKVIKEKSIPPEDIYADYTSGTKPMSAALVFAAISLNLNQLVYIHGQRDPNGRVISGTEKTLSFTPNDIRFQQIRNQVLDLFNLYHFQSALHILSSSLLTIFHPQHKEELQFLQTLCEAYQAWDAFDFHTASEKFASLNEDFSAWLKQYQLQNKVDTANRLVRLEKKNEFASERALDLLANADRRAHQGHYDQAISILYRLLEFIAQFLLNQKGIDTSNVDPQKIPRSVRQKWLNRKTPDGKIKTGLLHDFELLQDLGVEIGTNFMTQYKDEASGLRGYIEARNLSYFHHGFQHVSRKTCEKFREIICQHYLPTIVNNFNDKMKDYEFPQIKIVK
ncbi:MAG: TIGR02710 family CRISPR-associated CARF protein [bacterium JZ-2024 1]